MSKRSDRSPDLLIGFRWLCLIAVAVTLLCLGFIEASALPNLPIFWYLLTEQDSAAAWLFLPLLALAASWGRGSIWADRIARAVARHPVFVVIALWAVLALGTKLVYHAHPLSMDEYAAWFQAQVFAAGRLHGQFPPELLDHLLHRGFQNNFLMVNRQTGAVVSAYWPGFALLLAPFAALGVPWACNPTITVLSLLMIRRLAETIFGSETAQGWAVLFALASPVFLINGISYYAMPAHLLLNLIFAWLMLKPSAPRLFVAGLVGGCALVLHNPFPHALFALPWIVWLVLRSGHGLRGLLWLLAGYLPVIALLGAGWTIWQRDLIAAHEPLAAAVTPLIPAAGEITWLDQAMKIVNGLTRHFQWPDPLIVHARLAALVKLWLWGMPLLLLLAWLGGRRAESAPIRLLGASALLTFFGYFFIPFDQGHGWGYRYFHSAWGTLPLLAAAGISRLRTEPGVTSRLAPAGLLALVVLSITLNNGLRFVQVAEFMDRHLAQMPPLRATGRQIVFRNNEGYYPYDLIQNDPWLRGRTVIMRAMGTVKEGEVLQRYFPGIYEQESNAFGTTYFLRESLAH